MPKEASLKAALRRIRRRDNPRLPASLSELTRIPDKYRSINGDQWLIRHSMTENCRYLLFGCNQTINAMSRSRIWYLDGTFKCRPLLFAQLYVIHYEYQDHVIPGIFVLMENKTQRSYNDVFGAIRDRMPEDLRTGPSHFSMDFELGAANAFKEVFENTEEAFCFFHLTQTL